MVLFPALLENSLSPEELSKEAQDSKVDHERTASLFAQLREMTHDYTPPEDWACASTRGLFHQLEGLEADTLEHVHLENFVLFPKLAAARRAQAAAT